MGFEKKIKKFAKEHSIPIELSFRKGAYPYAISKQEKIVQVAKEAVTEIRAINPSVKVFEASCDMYVFGRAGIPTIVFGPGDLKEAHAVNEYVEIEDIVKASRIYTQIILNFFSR